MQLIQPLALALAIIGVVSSLTPVAAATPANHEQLRIHTSLPKKASDSLFSYSPEWRIDDGELYRTTGLSFFNAAKSEGSDPALIAKKLVTSVKDGMIQLDPHWRGITVTQPEDKAELLIANKAGYSLNTVIVKDYTNQTLRFDLVDKSFSSAGVLLAIDLVYAADVEYLEGFSSKKAQSASQGSIEIVVEGQAPVVIKTDGKTTRELEQELARQLKSASLSETALIPHIINKDTRNNKPFDGSEIQWPRLDAKSISISVDDPSLGVLTKFQFPDENHSVQVAEPRFMVIGLAVFVALIGIYFVRGNARRRG